MTEQILAVQKMQDYIETHLAEEITLATLADICNFSPWYAHRLSVAEPVSGAYRICSCGVYPSDAAGKVRSALESGTCQNH